MTTTESRQAFYREGRKLLAAIKKHPRMKRKELIPLLAFLFEGTLLILEGGEPADVKKS